MRGTPLTIVGTAIHLHPHADCPLVWTVRVEPDLGGQHHGVEVLLDSDVGVGVALHDLGVLDVPVPHPLVQAGSEVLQHVVLGELGPLAVAEPAHGFCARDHVDLVQRDFYPLRAVFTNHVPGTPGSPILVHTNPRNIFLQFSGNIFPMCSFLFNARFEKNLFESLFSKHKENIGVLSCLF